MRPLIKFGFLSFFLIFRGGIIAQDASPAKASFSVSISTPDSVVRAGSDVKMKITFVNDTRQNLFFGVGGPGRGGPPFDMDVRDSRGEQVLETDYGLKMQGKPPRPTAESKGPRPGWAGSVFRATLSPGQKLEEDLMLNKEYDLIKPGVYTVRVGGSKTITGVGESNLIRITVIP
jgi:hypothetical protein